MFVSYTDYLHHQSSTLWHFYHRYNMTSGKTV